MIIIVRAGRKKEISGTNKIKKKELLCTGGAVERTVDEIYRSDAQ